MIRYTKCELEQIIDGLNPEHINSKWDYETVIIDLAKTKREYESILSEIKYVCTNDEDAGDIILSILEMIPDWIE